MGAALVYGTRYKSYVKKQQANYSSQATENWSEITLVLLLYGVYRLTVRGK